MTHHRSGDREFGAGARVGRWRVCRLLARGGTSTVYEAVGSATGKPAALKLMRHDFSAEAALADRFVREAAVVVEMAHPGVPRILQVGRLNDGRVFLAMELLHGHTLADRLATERAPLAVGVEILHQLCSVLEAAHRRGVVHRDLKPDNIFVLEDHEAVRIKLLDWGIARHFDLESESTSLTETGTFVGTPRYLAPEQARGQQVDARADIYTLGLVAYELLLGVYPFSAQSLAETLMMQMVQAPPAPCRFWPGIPPTLERVLLAMLAKDPALRPSLPEITRVFLELDRDAFPPSIQRPFQSGAYDAVPTLVEESAPDLTARWRRQRRA